ncbi:MAG: DUF5320 domain-containing protein [Anaerolineae bacterium]
MPGGDGTGPRGTGPLTGRRMGICAGYATLGYAQCGQGYSRGRRNRFYTTGLPGFLRVMAPSPTAEQEKQELRQRAALLSRQLEDLINRLAEPG